MFCSWKPAPDVFTVFLCLLTLSGEVNAHDKGPDVVRVVAKEGSDAILPCSLDTKEDIESQLFDWKKDGQKEVFLYDFGFHYNNGRPGQDEQFKGRVSHFPDQLKNGNASIIIRNTMMADSGNYTCVFPRLQPNGQIFPIKLVVDLIFKDRSGEITGAAPKPYIMILKDTEDTLMLQCDVQGASPKPKVEWKDSDGNILPAEEPKVTERGGRYDVTLLATVNKTDHFHCVVTQEETGHQTEAETFVFIPGKVNEDSTRKVIIGWSGGLLIGLVFGVLGTFAAVKFWRCAARKRTEMSRRQQRNDSYKAPVDSVEQEKASRNKPPDVSSEVSADAALMSPA